MTQELDDGQRSVAKKIEKMLRVANSTTHPGERDAALKMAQDLMLAYNLDASVIGTGDDGKREEDKLASGFYAYERDLMERIAEVNFCLYWYSRDYVERSEAEKNHIRNQRYKDPKRRTHQLKFQHHLIGRRLNVIACKQMYRYIQQTTDRLTREFIAPGLTTDAAGKVAGINTALRTRRAVSFREGIAEEVSTKLWQRRQDQLAEERKAQAAEAARYSEAAAAGMSSSTALTISSVRQTEADANNDMRYGMPEGWTAGNRAKYEAEAARRRAAEQAYTKWAAEHPEEAAEAERKRREEAAAAEKARGKRRVRWSGGPGSRGGKTERDKDWSAYEAGRTKGKAVGLEPQAEHSSAPRKIEGRV